jgi:hypothetical protein
MILYHGSSKELSSLESRQASSEHNVPEGELLDAIYLTPNLDFAIACAARPPGATDIDDDDKIIEFEHPELFDPEKEIFVYEFDSEKISQEHIRQVDEKQYAIEGINELIPENVLRFKGEEVLKYYELINWKKEGNEAAREMKFI